MLPLRNHEPRPFLAPILLCLLLALLANLAATGCGGRTIVGGGPAYSAGSVAVPGTQSGTGLGVEVGHYQPLGTGWIGGVLAADYAGYTSAGDGDEILWTELQARYRRDLGGPGRSGPYLAAGPSLGYTLGYLSDVVIGAVLEAGYELRLAGPLAIDVSLRERPAYFISGGDPFGEFHNTLMVGLDLVVVGQPSR